MLPVCLILAFAIFAAQGAHLVDRGRKREIGDIWQNLRRKVARTPLWPASLTGDDTLCLVLGLVPICHADLSASGRDRGQPHAKTVR
jgi:hypothetical protein